MPILHPGLKHARANPSTQQTNTNIIALDANSLVNVAFVYLSSDTEMTFTLLDSVSHTVIWRQYVGARGGQGVPSNITTLWGEGVDFSTSVNGNIYIDLEWSHS